MSITAGSLYRDTGNFFRHQMITILLMALLTSFITLLLNQALAPGLDVQKIIGEGINGSASNLMEVIGNLPPEKQQQLLRASAAETFSMLVGTVLLLGGMLSLIPLASSGQRVSALRAIGASAPRLPALLLLVILITLMVQFSIMLFGAVLGLLALAIPGGLLAVVLALAPVILITEKVGVFSAIRASVKLGWQQIKLIAPAVILWFLAEMIVKLLGAKLLPVAEEVIQVMISAVANVISALLIIYLSRLYMLLR